MIKNKYNLYLVNHKFSTVTKNWQLKSSSTYSMCTSKKNSETADCSLLIRFAVPFNLFYKLQNKGNSNALTCTILY